MKELNQSEKEAVAGGPAPLIVVAVAAAAKTGAVAKVAKWVGVGVGGAVGAYLYNEGTN